MEIISSIYKRLPIVRELLGIRSALNRLAEQQVALRESAVIQALQTIKSSDSRYTDPKRLLVHGAQHWSQNYEDGMIAEIFRRVQSSTQTFLEIGVGDGSENNTAALLAQGWKGWWLEGNPHHCSHIRHRLNTMPSLANRLTLKQAFVSPANIQLLLDQLGTPSEIDLFSLDIDQDTYHIWAALPHFRPRVIVVEYNAAIPPFLGWIHPYETGRTWDGSQAYGASLKSFEELGRKLGYSLVGCDIIGVNAFFVRDDLVGDKFKAPFTAENHHEPPRFGLLHHWGHPSAFFGESHGPGATSMGQNAPQH